MKRHTLKVSKREITGKKVKNLRHEGFLPGNIYGKDLASVAVQVNLKEFQQTYKEAGETGVVYLDLDGEQRPVLIHNTQLDYMTQQPIHADFYQVNLKEKVKTMVQVVIIGEAKAVGEKLGQVLQTLNEIEVEALPTDLPEKFEVDVTELAAVNDQITVGDLKKADGVEILNEASQVIVKIAELVEPEPEPVIEAVPAEGEAAEAAGGEAKPAEAQPAEEKSPKEEKK